MQEHQANLKEEEAMRAILQRFKPYIVMKLEHQIQISHHSDLFSKTAIITLKIKITNPKQLTPMTTAKTQT